MTEPNPIPQHEREEWRDAVYDLSEVERGILEDEDMH